MEPAGVIARYEPPVQSNCHAADVVLDDPIPPPTFGGAPAEGEQVAIRHQVVPLGAVILLVGFDECVERPVVVGRRARGLAEVKEGLEAAEVVVLYPGDRVAAGARVKPRD